MPELSILMLSWLRLDSLLRSLKTIPKSCSTPLHLILRVQGDENLTDKDRRKIRKAASGFTSTDIYFTRDNVGTAAARLDLLHRAALTQTPYILFTDDDITFQQNGIDEQLKLLKSDPSIGSVSLKPVHSRHVESHFEGTPPEPTYREISIVGTASLMCRLSLYTRHLIAPDPEYYIGTWDWDFSIQIRLADYKLIMITNYFVINHHGGEVEYKKKRNNRLYIKENRKLFFSKWGMTPEEFRTVQLPPMPPLTGKDLVIDLRWKTRLLKN